MGNKHVHTLSRKQTGRGKSVEAPSPIEETEKGQQRFPAALSWLCLWLEGFKFYPAGVPPLNPPGDEISQMVNRS